MAELDHINVDGTLYELRDAKAYQKPNSGIPPTDLTSAIQELLQNASTALQPSDLSTLNSDVAALKALVETDSDNVIDKFNEIVTFLNGISASSSLDGIISNISSQINAKYTMPTGGIPMNDLSSEVQQAIGSGGSSPTITMDDTPTSGSSNPVKSSGIYNALQGKQNTLTFDSTPTASSSNPVTSGGVKAALDLKANQSTTYTKTEVDALFDDVAYLGDDDGQATTLDFDPQADTVWNIPQTLGSSQQAQARANIGVVDVSGTNDGTNWTSITIGSTTKAIPSGGGGGGGETNVIESISINGTTQTVTNKNVDLPVPTSTTIETIVTLTEAQYTDLATKDSATLYVIIES